MRFESKHLYFKRCARSAGNFVNLTKTLSQKHQLLQAQLLYGGLCDPAVYYEGLGPLSDLNNADQPQSKVLKEFFKDTSALYEASMVTIQGVTYKSGTYILLGGEPYEACFGEIQAVISGRDAIPRLLVKQVDAAFLPNFRVFKLIDSPPAQYRVVDSTAFLDAQAYSPYHLLGSLVVRLHSSVVWPDR